MGRTLADMKTDVDIGCRSDARGIVSSSEITALFNARLRQLQMSSDFRGTIQSTPIDVFTGIYEYEAPSGYKAVKSLQPTYGVSDFDMLTSNEWKEKKGSGATNIIADKQRGSHKVLLISSDTGEAITSLALFNTYDEEGTLTAVASTDTVNIRTVDGTRYKNGSAAAFDIDVSASVSHTAGVEIDLTTSVDLSSYEDIGTGFLEMFMPQTLADSLTSVRLRFGSSDSDYWESTVTSSFDGADFAKGNNVLGFAWDSATETGSPDSSEVSYIQILATYASGMADTSLIALQDLRFVNPAEHILEHYSMYFVEASDGTLQYEFEADSDTSLLERFEDNVLVEGVVADVNHLRVDTEGSARSEAKFERYLSQLTNAKPTEKKSASQTYYEL